MPMKSILSDLESKARAPMYPNLMAPNSLCLKRLLPQINENSHLSIIVWILDFKLILNSRYFSKLIDKIKVQNE